MQGNARSSIFILNKPFTAMPQENNQEVDLTSLENIELMPNWTSNNEGTTKHQESNKTKRQKELKSVNKNGKKANKGNNKYKLIVSADQDVLKKLKTKIKETGITYSLSEIVDVICNDLNRLHFKVKGIDDNKPEEFIFEHRAKKYFINKTDAINYFIKNGVGENKIIKNLLREEKPKGKFNYVLECPKTKKLLPPFNLHNSEIIIKQHLFISGISESYSMYIKDLKKIQEEEIIKKWSDEPIKHYEFMIENKEESRCTNLDTITKKIETKYFSSIFRTESIVKFKFENINNLPKDVKDFAKGAISNRKNWYNSLFVDILINMKKSKFSVYKISDLLFVSPHKLNKVADNKLTIVASEIIKVIQKNKNISKKELVKNQELEKFSVRDIVLEIRWLVHQGFISIYSDNKIKIT